MKYEQMRDEVKALLTPPPFMPFAYELRYGWGGIYDGKERLFVNFVQDQVENHIARTCEALSAAQEKLKLDGRFGSTLHNMKFSRGYTLIVQEDWDPIL